MLLHSNLLLIRKILHCGNFLLFSCESGGTQLKQLFLYWSFYLISGFFIIISADILERALALYYHTCFLRKTGNLCFIGREVYWGNICPLLKANLENGIILKSLLYCHCHEIIFSVDILLLLYIKFGAQREGKLGGSFFLKFLHFS